MPRPAHIPAPTHFAIERQGRVLLLDYDHGLEHGPSDFSEATVDPRTIINLAHGGQFTGIVLQKGVARSYYDAAQSETPLIIKLNGKTNLAEGQDPYSPQICSVEEAQSLGARAVGYTVYLGSQFEAQMFKEFAAIVEQAHKVNLPVLGWMLPRGKHIHRPTDRDMAAYAARVALELGADYVLLRYTGPNAAFGWVVESAGKCKVVPLVEEATLEEAVQTARGFVDSGAAGVVVGRAVWAVKDSNEVAQALSKVIFD